ncbi:hypothetical protein GCM10007424_11400 [Flavobacterium suaedae]|uniref:Uncharacterized protein n=1 Tax=Flavobacterium suaedae TaxID=1767027 RepID=A0ABQ1JRZ6_9FLAO|nr:hypothetical protein [Flavobacterium suaedae]GGB73217.1 hypothetical protein GCM10007424_11400 [Flavobacterium suaedae]
MGNTVGYVLISYDINKSHTQVKTELESLGYSDNFKYKNGVHRYYLPNTTLWHSRKSSTQAMNDLKTVCKKLNVVLDKGIAVIADEFVGA